MVDKLVEEFYTMYPNAPNPENYPKAFEHYAKMFFYTKQQKEKSKMSRPKVIALDLDGTVWKPDM